LCLVISLVCVFAVEDLKARLSSIENRTKEAVAQLAEMGGEERLMDRTAKYFELTAEEEERLRRQDEAQLQEEWEEQARRRQEEEAAQRERRLGREQRGREMAREMEREEPVRQQERQIEPVRQQGRVPEPARQAVQRKPSRSSSFWRQQEEELGEERPQAAQNGRQPQQEQPRHQQQERVQQERQQQREEQEQPRQPVRAEGERRWLHLIAFEKEACTTWNAASVGWLDLC
jgi:colicin import membrane protein